MNIYPAPPTELLTPSADRPTPDHDELLQLSRRIDWRFLLPQPDLADTAYVGKVDTGLLESLRQFCSTLIELEDPAVNSPDSGRFSLVVAHNPTQAELAWAAQAVSPGGHVYVEIHRRRIRRRNGRGHYTVRSMSACLAAMSRLRLVKRQVHWHWPNFESCTELIPLCDHSACVCALRRRGSGAVSQWKSRFAMLLLRLHLLTSVVPCFSVLGQRFQQEDSGSRPTSPMGQSCESCM